MAENDDYKTWPITTDALGRNVATNMDTGETVNPVTGERYDAAVGIADFTKDAAKIVNGGKEPPKSVDPEVRQAGIDGHALAQKAATQLQMQMNPPSALPGPDGVDLNTLDPQAQKQRIQEVRAAQNEVPGQIQGAAALPLDTKITASSTTTTRSGDSREVARGLTRENVAQTEEVLNDRAQVRALYEEGMVREFDREVAFRKLDEKMHQNLVAVEQNHVNIMADIAKRSAEVLAKRNNDIVTAVDALSSLEGDTSTFWQNQGTPKTILGAISMAVGAFASGLNGGPNYALQIIDSAIQQDFQERKFNIEKGKDRVSQAVDLYSGAKAMFDTEVQHENAVLAAMYKKAEKEVAFAKAQYGLTGKGLDELQNSIALKGMEKIVLVQQDGLADHNKATKLVQDQARLDMDWRRDFFSMENMTGKNKNLPRVLAPASATGIEYAALPVKLRDGSYYEPTEHDLASAKTYTDQAQELYGLFVNLADSMVDTTSTIETRKAKQTQAALKLFGVMRNDKKMTTEAIDAGFIKVKDTATGQSTFDLGSMVTKDTVQGLYDIIYPYLQVRVRDSMRVSYGMALNPEMADYWRVGMQSAYRNAVLGLQGTRGFAPPAPPPSSVSGGTSPLAVGSPVEGASSGGGAALNPAPQAATKFTVGGQ